MAILEASVCIDQIGETAGEIWHLLAEENEPVSLAQLAKRIDQPRDVIMQGIGWLAREDKIHIEENGRTRYVTLTDY